MNLLDTRTVLFSSVITSAICALVMASLWRQNRRRSPELGFWLADFSLQFLSILLIALRGVLPDVVSVLFGVPFILTGALLLLIGLERYLGKTSAWRYNFGLLAGFILVHAYYIYEQPNLAARNINFSLGLLVICGQCAWLLLRRVDVSMRPETQAVGVIFGVYSFVSLLRIYADLVAPHNSDLFTSGLYDTLALLIYQILLIALTFALFLMVNRRLITALENDITERRQAEEALRQSEARYRQAQQIGHVGNWEFNVQTNTFWGSDEAKRLYGFDPHLDDFSTDEVEACIPEREQVHQALIDLIETGKPYDLEFEIRPRNTTISRIISSLAELQKDESGQPQKVVGVIQDITERKRADEALRELNATLEQHVADRTAELQAANARLTELDRLKDEFLARISHELRTPLAGILISLELLETSQPEKRERYMQRLKQATDRLRDMIEDVLMFSQLNLYTQPAILQPIDLNNLIEGRSTTWQKLRAGRKLQFQLDLARDLPPARADGELFIQALTRLISNAINYTPAGSVIVSTARIDEDDRQWVAVSVTDTGPGITPEDLPNIFERFYRGRAAADYKTPGTGVGLSISREIAQKLGGRMTVETEVGAGSTFTMWLPVWPETAEGRAATEVPSL